MGIPHSLQGTMSIPHSLEESKVLLDCLSKKCAQILKECKDSGKHDTSKGEFFHVRGEMNVGGLVVSGCQVGIRVAGECPNCYMYYERNPTKEEMQTQKYKEMVEDLTDRKELERIYTAPIF